MPFLQSTLVLHQGLRLELMLAYTPCGGLMSKAACGAQLYPGTYGDGYYGFTWSTTS